MKHFFSETSRSFLENEVYVNDDGLEKFCQTTIEVALLRNTKNNYCENLDEKGVTDKHFWKTVKLHLFDMSVKGDKKDLSENGEF